MDKKTVVIGVLGTADDHFVAITLLEQILKKANFDVVNLGTQCSQKEFIDAAVETNAAAILMSSKCGYAETDAEGIREKLAEVGLGNIVLYIGGTLTISSRTPEEIIETFKKMGFNRVYPGETDLEEAVDQLRTDLKGVPACDE